MRVTVPEFYICGSNNIFTLESLIFHNGGYFKDALFKNFKYHIVNEIS